MAGSKKKHKRMTLAKRRALLGWVFVAPFVLGFLFLFSGIYANSFRFSFMQVDVLQAGGYSLRFLGLSNYKKMLTVDPDFTRNLIGSVRDMLINIPIIIMFSLFIATMLNKKMKGRALFRAIFFVPVILATGIIEKADLANSILNAYEGIDVGRTMRAAASAGSLFGGEGLKEYLQEIFSFSSVLTDITVGAAENIYWVVSNCGVQILIFLAGLQSISPALYEAAQIEGCSGWESFWKITFPMISPMILTNIVYSLVDSFTNSKNQIMAQISSAMKVGNYGEASAMAWLYFAVIACIIGVIAFAAGRLVFYNNKDS